MQNLENMDVFEILITQKLLKCKKDPFVRSALIYIYIYIRGLGQFGRGGVRILYFDIFFFWGGGVLLRKNNIFGGMKVFCSKKTTISYYIFVQNIKTEHILLKM